MNGGKEVKIILLPGLDGTGELFGPFLAKIPEHWSALVVSYPRDQLMNYPECVAFARDRLPVDEDFVLLGESFSGPVSIALAAQHHPNLRGLVLCNSFARHPWWQVFGALPWPSIFSRPIPSLIMRHMGALKNNSDLRMLLQPSTGADRPLPRRPAR